MIFAPGFLLFFRHCEEALRRSNPVLSFLGFWIASLAPAIGRATRWLAMTTLINRFARCVKPHQE
jgi:hypothetical protein